ncbi:GNAT family N-acetyltransferase [Microbacterium sp. SD291]|uniref:GNAT family N-acetyltransferase n=1 Tax=Microbacterium sp. SD291 TaxID=2782007 RepID=UPI001A96DBF8|nr:GNAT family N-acetyltransferase [Microbacterium sp. SD291]MBO0979222.1 GNAT family N-acetyltransferase [Microbacterium sp. SD291]
MEPVTLTTERLVLRAPADPDVEAIERACQDPEIPRWTTVPSPYTREHAVSFIEMVAKGWAEDHEYVWAIRADGTLVGMIGLHDVTPNVDGAHAEIGYWMVPEARGRGYLGEAARAVVDWAFADRGLVRLGWRAVAGNIPSARTARSLGFRYEGLQRLALTGPRGRDDGWFAGILATDDRTPQDWPVL